MDKNKIEELVNSLTSSEKDALYRRLWEDYVYKDIEAHAVDMELELTEEQISNATIHFVYNGDYDCNLDYWANIENVIEDVIR